MTHIEEVKFYIKNGVKDNEVLLKAIEDLELKARSFEILKRGFMAGVMLDLTEIGVYDPCGEYDGIELTEEEYVTLKKALGETR